MFENFCFKIYEYYLNFHDNLFELYLEILGYNILDYTRFYYFEYDCKYLVYNSDYNNICFVKNHVVINKINSVVYYEEKNDKSKTIFKFNTGRNVVKNFSNIATDLLKDNLNNFDLDKFFVCLNEEDLSYVTEKINRLGV
jgi:hypothetical protein